VFCLQKNLTQQRSTAWEWKGTKPPLATAS